MNCDREATILIHRNKTILPGRPFTGTDTARALELCLNAGYSPLFADTIAVSRIKSASDSEIWTSWYTTMSMLATGKTRGNSNVVVYSHLQNILCDPGRIRQMCRHLIKGAGILPSGYLHDLIDLEDGKDILVVDHDRWARSKNGTITLEEAVSHPKIVPFIGSTRRTERYFTKFREVYGKDTVKIDLPDDKGEKDVCRLLVMRDDQGFGTVPLNYLGRILAIPRQE
jgi:hypothetical protein